MKLCFFDKVSLVTLELVKACADYDCKPTMEKLDYIQDLEKKCEEFMK